MIKSIISNETFPILRNILSYFIIKSNSIIQCHAQYQSQFKCMRLQLFYRCTSKIILWLISDPHIAIALDPKISNEIYDPQAIYVVRCSVNAPRGIPVIDLDYNGTKKELFKIKAANTTKRKHQVVKDAYVSLPNVGNITCNISDSLGSYHKTKSIVFFQKGKYSFTKSLSIKHMKFLNIFNIFDAIIWYMQLTDNS